MTTLAQLTAELQRLEREHGPDCSVRTFDLALYKHGYLHRLTLDYPAEREAQQEAAAERKCEAQRLCEFNLQADSVVLEPAIVVTIKPGTPAFDTEALVAAIRAGGPVVVPEGVQVELLKEGQAKFSPEVRIVNCLNPAEGNADFLLHAVKRKPALDLSAGAGTEGGAQ